MSDPQISNIDRSLGTGMGNCQSSDPADRQQIDWEVSLVRTILDDQRPQEERQKLLERLEPDLFTTVMFHAFTRVHSMWERRGTAPNTEEYLVGEENDEVRNFFDDPIAGVREPYKSDAAIEEAIERLKSSRQMIAVHDALKDFDKSFSNADVLDNESRDNAIEKLTQATEKAKSGAQTELTRREQIIEFLDKKYSGQATQSAVRSKLGISKQHLYKIIKAEIKRESAGFRMVGRGKQARLILCRGMGQVKVMDYDGAAPKQVLNAAYLPEPMAEYFGYQGALNDNVFFILSAMGDGGKTLMLLNIARANALKGKQVLHITHEYGPTANLTILASMQKGSRVRDVNEAFAICQKTEWIRNIKMLSIPEAVNVNELQLQLKQYEFDVIVWDYLDSSFLRIDDAVVQGSHYAQMVQTLGTTIVDKGVPLFTAVQQGFGDKKVPDTWFRRGTISLIQDSTEYFPEAENFRTCYHIYKNKDSVYHEYVDFTFDSTTCLVQRAKPLSKMEHYVREENARKAAKAEAKERFGGEAGEPGEEEASSRAEAERDKKYRDKKKLDKFRRDNPNIPSFGDDDEL